MALRCVYASSYPESSVLLWMPFPNTLYILLCVLCDALGGKEKKRWIWSEMVNIFPNILANTFSTFLQKLINGSKSAEQTRIYPARNMCRPPLGVPGNKILQTVAKLSCYTLSYVFKLCREAGDKDRIEEPGKGVAGLGALRRRSEVWAARPDPTPCFAAFFLLTLVCTGASIQGLF